MDYRTLVENLNELLKQYGEKIPYGEYVGAPWPYSMAGDLIWPDPEPNFIELAAKAITELSGKIGELEKQLAEAHKTTEKNYQFRELTKMVSVDRLRELAQADRDGRCVVLPCKVGDKIYEIVKHRNSGNVEVIEYFVNSVEVDTEGTVVKSHRWRPTQTGFLSQKVPSWVKLSDFGKTVFLTREEAQAKLKERNAK